MQPVLMHNRWRQCLEASGAQICDRPYPRVAQFGDPHAETTTALHRDVVTDLSHYAVLRVGGEDAREFLHNQLTTDCRRNTPRETRLSAWCNPQGRMLALFRLSMREGDFLLRLPGSCVEPIQKRLSLFILRSRVRLEEVGESLVRVGVAGPGVHEHLERLIGQVPGKPGEASESGTLTLSRVSGALPRFEIFGPPREMVDLWESLKRQCRPVGEPAWRLLEVLSGLPEVYPATRGMFLPQMTNLHWLGGVDFRKGCYPGQEVVARMHYRGTLKRRLYLAHAPSTIPPMPGAPVLPQNSAEKAGTVVRAAPYPDGGSLLLAVLQTNTVAECRLELEGSTRLELRELPYETPAREAAAES